MAINPKTITPKKITHKDYLIAVRKAKRLLDSKRTYRIEICKLCVSVCDIQVGGHRGTDIYTVKRFAIDIGVSYCVMRDWVRLYRLVESKVPESIRLPRDRAIVKEVAKQVDELTSCEEVTEIYKRENTLHNKLEHSMRANMRYIRSILTSINKNPKKFKEMVHESTIEDMKDLLTKVNRELNRVNKMEIRQ